MVVGSRVHTDEYPFFFRSVSDETMDSFASQREIKTKIVGALAVAEPFPNTSMPRFLHLRISTQTYVVWNHAYSQRMTQTHLLTCFFLLLPGTQSQEGTEGTEGTI